MNKQDEFDLIVGLIYEAALDSDCWQAVLLHLSDLVNAAGTTLWVHDTGTGGVFSETGGENFRSVRFDPEFSTSYVDYYAQTNVWSKKEDLLLSEGSGIFSSNLFDDTQLLSSEFYGDWLRPQDLFYSMGVLVAKSGSLAVKLSALRSKRKGSFTDDDLALYSRLVPHLKRACDMNRRLAIERLLTENRLALSHITQDLSGLCLLGLSATGALLYANQFGEALLREGSWLTLRNDGLHAVHSDKDNELQLALRNTSALNFPHNLNLGGMNGNPHCCLTLMPVPIHDPLNLIGYGVSVIVLVTQNTRQRVATVRQLIDLFRFTPAEARVVRALTQGEDIDYYAKAEGLKKTTVRTQLHSAMMKTGSSKQKDLVRLILSLPAVRDI
jgi:DNA-binding CsgD family transcriptional regulator